MLACGRKYDNSAKVRFTHNVTINVPLIRFTTVSVVKGRTSLDPILSIKAMITIATMIKFHGDFDSTCKQNLYLCFIWPPTGMINVMNVFCHIS